MSKSSPPDPLKKTLAGIADQVSGLPEHLQQAAFTTLLNRALDSNKPAPSTPPAPPLAHAPAPHATPPPASSTFGDYFASFPADLSLDDQLLIAASFAETQSNDRSFTVQASHDLLKDIGIKLTNSGVYAKRLKQKQLIITLGRSGKRAFKFRLSPNGHKALKQLKETKK